MLLTTLKLRAEKIFEGFEQAVGDIYVDDIGDLLPCSVYLRKSVINDDKDAESIAAQLYYCNNEVTRLHWVITELYVDEGISASKGLERPDFNRMRADMSAGKLKRLIARDQARISREDVELFAFLRDITRYDVEVRDSRGGLIRNDLGTKIKGLVDADYSAAVSKANREKSQLRARAGKLPKTGRRPYAYTSGYVSIIESEADVLKEAKKRYLAGESLFNICKDLRRRGIKTTVGNEWTPSVLSRALQRPENAGLRSYREMIPSEKPGRFKPGPVQIVARDVCPKLWPESDYHLIMKAIGDNKPFSRNTARKYLLSSVLVCGNPRCARGLSARTEGSYARYFCSPSRGGCAGVRVPMRELDRFITELTYDALKKLPKFVEEVDDLITPRIEKLEAEVEELAVARESGDLSLNEYLRFKKPLDNQIAELRKQQTAAKTVPLPIDDAESFLNATTDKKRATIKRLWGHIGVKPSEDNAFHPDLLIIEPKMP